MQAIQPHERIIVAFDTSHFDLNPIISLLPSVGGAKVGLEAMNAVIPKGFAPLTSRVRSLLRQHEKMFMWDAKFCDIPNTVSAAVQNVVRHHRPWGITVMADAGPASVKAAVASRGNSLIIGVPVLTSLTDEDCKRQYGRFARAQTIAGAEMLLECGVQAIVCSPLELDAVRAVAGGKLICITPGIRANGAPPDDQKRTMTAGEAVAAGADYLVIGRPIMKAADPIAAAGAIAEEIAAAAANRSMM